MKKNNDSQMEENKTWNIAKKYSELKLMNPLEVSDKYEIIAQFGYESIEELNKLDIDEFQINYNKIKGFELLVSKLIQLIKNSEFSVKIDKDKIKNNLEKLELIESIIPNLYKKIQYKKFKLKPEYNIFFKIVRSIKSNINEQLNKNSLIYMQNQEISLKELIEKDEEEFINES